MSELDETHDGARVELEEFSLGETTVVMLSDQENDRAWIQSDETVPIER